MVANKPEFKEHQARIKYLLEKLKKKLKSFKVINLQAQIFGQIKDFYVDKSRRLYMLVEPLEAQAGSALHLLSSKYIYKVDTANQAILVDLSLAEFERFPTHQPRSKGIASSTNSSTPLANQESLTSSGETPARNEISASEYQPLGIEEEDQEGEGSQSSEELDRITRVMEEEIVRLLEERLVVNRSKRKVGEVVVRKEIETRIVEVPVQREKLIIEQVGAETKQLAEIDLGEGEVTGIELRKVAGSDTLPKDVSDSDAPYRVTGEFVSPKAASDLLEAIALRGQHGCKKVRVELVLDNPSDQNTYQQMFDRCSTG